MRPQMSDECIFIDRRSPIVFQNFFYMKISKFIKNILKNVSPQIDRIENRSLCRKMSNVFSFVYKLSYFGYAQKKTIVSTEAVKITKQENKNQIFLC